MKRLVALLLASALALVGVGAIALDRGNPLPAHASPCCTRVEDPGLGLACGAISTPRDEFFIRQGRSLTLRKGTIRRLQVSRQDNPITWKSSNASVASVTRMGRVRVKRCGAAVITAFDQRLGQVATCTVKAYRPCSRAHARKAILSLKELYPTGMGWTNNVYYFWQARQCHCYGCVAFAGIASDKAFGKFAPLKRHASFHRIRAGDHVRIAGNHSVVVLRKKARCIIVAEGNYDGAIRWGRTIAKDELVRDGFYVETRY